MSTDRHHRPLWWWLLPVLAIVPIIAGIDLASGQAVEVPGALSAVMATLACAHLATVGMLPLARRRTTLAWQLLILAGALTAGAAGAVWVGASTGAMAVGLTLVGVVWVPGVVRRSAFSAGILTFGTYAGLTAVSGIWGAWFLLSLDLSTVTTVLLWAAAILTAICLPSSVVQTYEAWETLLRLRWNRPRVAATVDDAHAPRVVIHVPIHAEPPEVVMATLDRLEALDYPDFEVLVIDNNTEDEALWRPVAEHCARLGERFCFVHLMGVQGAKAGALNEALRRTSPDVELVAVVDADYQVRPEWLRRTVGHFADESIAFVQCPHAYRSFHRSRFGRMADSEYRVFFETSMVAYNERDAALTVGTMSVIRRTVLQDVGGWAEWCLTEDSELSVRIHAAGHSSVYLTEPMGRGLIPETFESYRKQRFRWTYGPVQELRAHQGLFFPGRNRLSVGQLVHHGNHGLDVALIGVRFLTVPVTALAALSMVSHDEIIQVPLALWITATCLVVSSVIMRWLVLRIVLGSSIRRSLASVLAYLSLTYVIQTASLRAVLDLPASWERTTKFEARSHRLAAFASARSETLAGLTALAAAAAGLVALPHGGVAMMLLLGVGVVGAVYLTSPVVALIANHDLERRSRADPLGPAIPPPPGAHDRARLAPDVLALPTHQQRG